MVPSAGNMRKNTNKFWSYACRILTYSYCFTSFKNVKMGRIVIRIRNWMKLFRQIFITWYRWSKSPLLVVLPHETPDEAQYLDVIPWCLFEWYLMMKHGIYISYHDEGWYLDVITWWRLVFRDYHMVMLGI